MSSFFMEAIDSIEGSMDLLTESDIQYIESLRSAKRRAEVAAWRSLLRCKFSIKSDVLYYPSKAPYIEGSDVCISVSHSATHVAVMLSDSPCAIDIESLSRDFGRVASRYATAPELMLGSGADPLLAILWSAKETLYKLSPLDGLDLLHDIEVLSIEGDQILGRVKGCDGIVKMGYSIRSGHVVVYTLD